MFANRPQALQLRGSSFSYFSSMADAFSDAGDLSGEDESQEDVMTPAELVTRLEEVGDWT